MSADFDSLAAQEALALLPKVLTKRDIIRSVLERWSEQYAGRREEITSRLEALDLETASEADIEAIIGNNSWTRLECDVCERDREKVVSVPRKYEGPMAVCGKCADAVAAMLADPTGGLPGDDLDDFHDYGDAA